MRDVLEMLKEAVLPATLDQMQVQLNRVSDDAQIAYTKLYEALEVYLQAWKQRPLKSVSDPDELTPDELSHELAVLGLNREGSREELVDRLRAGWQEQDAIMDAATAAAQRADAGGGGGLRPFPGPPRTRTPPRSRPVRSGTAPKMLRSSASGTRRSSSSTASASTRIRPRRAACTASSAMRGTLRLR